MTMTAAAELTDLARLIARQTDELAALRRRLQSRLDTLEQRRESLIVELRQVEAEIESASLGEQPQSATTTYLVPKPSVIAPVTKPRKPNLSLPEFLLGLVLEGRGSPIALATLKEETVRRKFPTSSANLPKMIEVRVHELVKRGLLRRDPKSGGYLAADARAGAVAIATAAKAEQASKVGKGHGGQPTLKAVLLDLLKRSGRTMSAQELADQAKKAGYESKSKSFVNVVWVAVGKMPEVVRDPKGGYRLRKGKK